MKKIVKHPEGIRLEGIVEKDGIGFIPIKIDGPLRIISKGSFAKVVIESGNIRLQNINTNLEDESNRNCVKMEMDERIKKYSFLVSVISIVILAASFVMMIESSVWSNAKFWVNVFATILYLMLSVLIFPKAIAIFIGRLLQNKEIINFSKYLGAKNAVENAYYDLGRAPSMEEVKKYSHYSSRDKYTKDSYIAIIWLMIGCLRIFSDAWGYWFIIIMAFLVLCWLEYKNKLAFIQEMVVSKPDEIHYKAAITAIEEVAKDLELIQVNYYKFKLVTDFEKFDEKKCSKIGCPSYDFCKKESQKIAEEKDEKDFAK